MAALLALMVMMAGAETTRAAPFHDTSLGPYPVTPVDGQFRESCYRMRVQLNGDQTPTATCLLKNKPKPGDITPNIMKSACNTTDLQLFVASNYGGTELCFTGTGSTNLVNYWIDWPFTSWEEVVSSYKSGKWWGHFSYFANDGDPDYGLFDHVLCPWIGSYWNDHVRYVKLVGTGSAAQTFC